MLGDEVPAATPATAAPAASGNANTQALLMDIFGSDSSNTAAAASLQPAQSSQRSVQDILGLFGNSSSPAPTAIVSPVSTGAPSLFGGLATQAPAPAPAPVVQARTAAPGYVAYDNNELRIALTPQTSPTKPGLVMILARFQVTGSQAASNVNFQAAVPRVRAKRLLVNPRALTVSVSVRYRRSNCRCYPCLIRQSSRAQSRRNSFGSQHQLG